MSGQHTQGRLTANEDGYLLAESGHCLAAVGSWESTQDVMIDACRLAACWNACDGFDTDLLLNIAMLGDTLKQRFEGMQAEVRRVDAELAAARALLADAVKPHDEYVAQARAAGEAPTVNLMANRIHSFLKDGSDFATNIPAGWALDAADFSIIANGGSKPGSVMLVRAGEDRKNWHRFADADLIPLYATGRGMTYDEALQDAIAQARAAAPVPKGGAA